MRDHRGQAAKLRERRLVAQPFFSGLARGDVVANREVLPRLALRGDERNDGRIDPVDRAVLGAVAQLAAPDLAVRDRVPQAADVVLRVIRRVDEAMVLPEELLARILGDLTELVVDVGDDALLVRRRHDRRLIQRMLDVLRPPHRSSQRVIGGGHAEPPPIDQLDVPDHKSGRRPDDQDGNRAIHRIGQLSGVAGHREEAGGGQHRGNRGDDERLGECGSADEQDRRDDIEHRNDEAARSKRRVEPEDEQQQGACNRLPEPRMLGLNRSHVSNGPVVSTAAPEAGRRGCARPAPQRDRRRR